MGYFGETGTKATWTNPTVTPEAQRAEGGWYYNPASGSVDRWWGAGGTSTATAQAVKNTSSGGYTPQNFEDVLKGVSGTVGEAYKQSENVLNEGLAKTEANAAEREKLAREEMPIIQQRYKTLLEDLETKNTETQENIKGAGNAAIGETRARAGATGIYSSGVELGQEAKIGALTAKTLRQASGDYQTNIQKYLNMQSEEELNVRKNILEIIDAGDTASLKIRQAIAAIGPEKLNTAITLAAQIMTQDRAEQELGIKFSEEARAETLFPLQKQKLVAEIAKMGEKSESEKKAVYAKAASDEAMKGVTLTDLQNKYADKLTLEDVVKIYTAADYYKNAQRTPGSGAPQEAYAQEILGTGKTREVGDIVDGGDIGKTAGTKWQLTTAGWIEM
jgi:hypothetical protein